jgi:hypothetical protein
MLIGHYSAAFLAKRIAPAVPLSFYFVACQVIDFFWGFFVLFGIEKLRVIPGFNPSNALDLYFMPYTHSLPAAIVWSMGAAILYRLCAKSPAHRISTAILVGAVAGSHWLLDLVVHLPDLPLWFDSFKVGFGLWNYRYLALTLELVLLWLAVLASLKAAGENRWRYVTLAIVMSGVQITSLVMAQPATDYSTALQLLATYAALTLFSRWADKSRSRHELPHDSTSSHLNNR